MTLPGLNDFLARNPGVLAKGPVALIVVEDEVEIASTIAHHLQLGFRSVLVLLPDGIALPADSGPAVHGIRYDIHADQAWCQTVNAIIAATPPATWLYYGFNAEYLFFPFCETRSITDMLAFHVEERRDAMLAYVIDLYAGDLAANPDAVHLETAMLDRAGYYAQARTDAAGAPQERQMDFFGGVRWRFAEHIPPTGRRIDRVALFRARKDLRLLPDHRFSIEEYNTYACPWHHNLTAAVMSFRAAKALTTNPASRFAIKGFAWHGSTPFAWDSQQLMDLGLIEPGQWF